MKKILSLLLTLLLILSVPTLAFADSEITVTGTGEVQVPADMAIVSLGVTVTDKEVLKAQKRANQAVADIREALIDLGIEEEDINTDYINIYAQYDYSAGTEVLAGYYAGSTLAIRVTDMEQVGEVIDAAFAAGANTLNGITFSATDTKDAKAKALKAAVEDAREKAEVLAAASDLELLSIESITEGGTFSYDRGVMNNFAKEEAAAGTMNSSTVVRAAKLTVSSSVTVSFKAD